ncbi:hypothetical protein GCM10011378_26210 [Hymenobacter glacieicola]|uniref:Probable beta-carotene 15,15'-dioxygenase n=1 Tax=Hymenobacter glacieicola TaxID=1562124 RepID=A0ABQ1WX23_9BACT|nr:hypothetical protein GCM10011378_26210 [Hymenobacter glacieicola]
MSLGQACSYGLVAACCLLVRFPVYATAVLGPVLLLGLLGLGIAHGACDQLVWPAYRPVRGPRWAYQVRFGLGYLGLAGAVGLVWWQWPGVAAALFFALTAWHWGSADAPAHPQRGAWLAHSLLRGALLFALPAYFWPAETVRHVNGLLLLTGAQPTLPSAWSGLTVGLLGGVLAGHLGLWAYFAWQRLPARWLRDAGEALLLAGLFSSCPPLLALGVYFVFWHSLQHILRLAPLLGYAAGPARARTRLIFFARRALPMLAASLALLAGAYVLGSNWLPAQNAWLGLVVLAASVVTVPHALLVTLVMDAPKWQARPSTTSSKQLLNSSKDYKEHTPS